MCVLLTAAVERRWPVSTKIKVVRKVSKFLAESRDRKNNWSIQGQFIKATMTEPCETMKKTAKNNVSKLYYSLTNIFYVIQIVECF